MPEDFLPSLIADLRRRLEEIDAEKLAIARALRALEGHKPRHARRNLRTALVERIGASPGSRVSFLALEFGVSATRVMAELQALEQDGDVVKRGLGWEMAKARRPSSPSSDPLSTKDVLR